MALAVMQGCAGGASRQRSGSGEETDRTAHVHDTTHADGHVHEPHDADEPHDGHGEEEHAAHGHMPEQAASEVAATDEIVFPADQAARVGLRVEQAERGGFRETLHCSGELYAPQCQVSVVSAPIAGVVTFVDGHVVANTSVDKGQGLFWLSSGGLASGDDVQKARIAFHKAEADFERISALYDDKLVTQRDYLAAEAEYLRAKAVYDPVRVSGEKGTLVKSPADGYVSQMSVAAGDYVTIGQPLATIANTGRMQLRVLVSQRYFQKLNSFTDARFRTPAMDGFITVSELGGERYASGRMVEQGTSLVPVVFEFDADGRFPDGAYADVVLVGGVREDVVTVPLSALTEQQGVYYVYEQLDEECYRRLPVVRGADDGLRVEILEGLEGGELIVTEGAVNVRMAAASGSIPHGHTH